MGKAAGLGNFKHPKTAPELPEASRPAEERDDDKADVKPFIIRLNAAAHKQLKHLGVELNMSSNSIMAEGLNLFFEKHGLPMVAKAPTRK